MLRSVCEIIPYSSGYAPQPENVHDVPRAPCPETLFDDVCLRNPYAAPESMTPTCLVH